MCVREHLCAHWIKFGIQRNASGLGMVLILIIFAQLLEKP